MKAVSQDYKNEIKEFGREIDSIITYDDDGTTITLGVDDLNLIEPHYNGDILKSVMKVLEVDSNINIPLGTEINYQFGVKTHEPYNGTFSIQGSTSQSGTPSPTSPQPITNKTGTITEVINGNSYQFDLGSLELCKIGNYTDEILKSSGKNLFDVFSNVFLGTASAKTPTISSDGKITSEANYATARGKGMFVELENNTTYTLSFNVDSIYASTGIARVFIEGKIYNGTSATTDLFTGTSYNTTGLKSITFTTPTIPEGQKCGIIFNGGWYTGATVSSTFSNVMIEKSPTTTDYEPYGTGWYIKKNIGKTEMKDLSNWSRASDSNFYLMNFPSTYGYKNDTLFSNIFEYNTTAWGGDGQIGITSSNNLWITTGDSTIQTINNVPTWLANKNAIMYGILATPTYTPITGTLATQLNAVSTGWYEYVDYGNYIVYSSEKQEDTNSYKLVCYDKMLYAMKKYESFATYPITIRTYLNTLCTHIGLTFKNRYEDFWNYNHYLDKELYLGKDSDNSDFTYRDVLDDIAQITCSTICINSNDELELRYINNNANMPYDYEKADYITGTSQIELYGNYTLALVEFELNELSSSFVIATNGDERPTYNRSLYYADNKFTLRIGNQTYQSSNITLAINTKYQIYFTNYGINLNNTQIISRTSPRFNTKYIFGDANINLYEVYYGQGDFYPYIIKSENKIVLSQSSISRIYYPDIETDYVAHMPPSQIEIVDTDYFNENNVNFSKVYGPINTITLKDSNNKIISSYSIPDDLQEDQKNEIVISDNIILENYGWTYTILQKLYRLSYTLNNYRSTGITWLELCDRYQVQLDIPNEDGTNRTATYDCIMLNDDVQIDRDIVEDVYTEEPFQSQMEYRNKNSINTLSGFQIEKDSFNNTIEYVYTNRTSPLGNTYSYNADDVEGSTIASTSYSSMTADEKAQFLAKYGFASESLMYDKWDINDSGTIDATDISTITTFVNNNEPSNVEINSGSSDNSPSIILGGKYSTNAVVIDNEGNIELNKYENGVNHQTLITPTTLDVNEINLGQGGLTTYSPAGYTIDQYGNFHHQQSTTEDEWELYDYYENIRLKYLWETGVLKLNDLDVKTTSYIYAMPSSDITIPNGSYTEATNLTSVYSKGNLSISNGKIKIGSHISYIKITITIGLNNYNDDLYSFLTKNGTSAGFWLVNNITGSYSATIRSEILPVSENDEISFNVYLGSGGTLVSNRTNVIVEAL